MAGPHVSGLEGDPVHELDTHHLSQNTCIVSFRSQGMKVKRQQTQDNIQELLVRFKY